MQFKTIEKVVLQLEEEDCDIVTKFKKITGLFINGQLCKKCPLGKVCEGYKNSLKPEFRNLVFPCSIAYDFCDIIEDTIINEELEVENEME